VFKSLSGFQMASPDGLSTSAPAKIQVVFQGGGAKLVCLMAVADVLQTYQNNKKIEITRTAGSSAGAIAAVMLATDPSKKSIKVYKSDLLRVGAKYLKAMKTSLPVGLWHIAWGASYFGDFDLKSLFNELICGDDLQFLHELSVKDTRVYYTDLYSLNSYAAAADQSIAQALAESCNFPFAFVGFGAGNTRVDGGLALNLPVDQLRDEASAKGPVIAIGFQNNFGNQTKRNILSYTQQLFSAAVQSSVYRSEEILGREHVHRINTSIGTFDFEMALDIGLSSEYERVSLKFAYWLDEWLAKHGPVVSAPRSSLRLLRPALSPPWPIAVVNELNDRIKSDSSTKALSVLDFETALFDEEGNFANKYFCRALKTFEIVRSINSIQFSFQVGRIGSFDSANLACSGYDSRGAPLAFNTHVQELTKSGDKLRSFRVFFLFNDPLLPSSPNQPYTVEYQYEASDPYPNLGKGPEARTLGLRQGAAEIAVVGVAFPRSKLATTSKVTDIHVASAQLLRDANYDVDDDVLVPSEELQLFEFVDQMNLAHGVDKYWLVGRRVENASRESAFGFVIE
jgi:predicted acylesterase/phospholipase RssA